MGENGLRDQVCIRETQCAGEQREIPMVAFNKLCSACY